MKKLYLCFVLTVFVFTLCGCQTINDSPFTNLTNDGFDNVDDYIDRTKELLNEYIDYLPKYDELRDGSPGCLTQDYMRTDQENYILSSNKDFYKTTDRYIKINDVYRALTNANNILEKQNEEKPIKEGNDYLISWGSLYTVTYYIEGTDFYYLQSKVEDENETILTLQIDLTVFSETVTLTEEIYSGGERVNLFNVELDLDQMIEVSYNISETSIKYVEKDENNSMLVFIKYNVEPNDLDYSEILYFDALANEQYHNIAISPEVITYTKYEGDHIKYSFNLNDVSRVTYNMHYLDGWSMISPSLNDCAFFDIYLDEALVLHDQEVIRRTGDQYYISVSFDEDTLTDTLLSLAGISLHSDLTLDFIHSKQSFSFDDVIIIGDVVSTFDELEDLLNTYD